MGQKNSDDSMQSVPGNPPHDPARAELVNTAPANSGAAKPGSGQARRAQRQAQKLRENLLRRKGAGRIEKSIVSDRDLPD